MPLKVSFTKIFKNNDADLSASHFGKNGSGDGVGYYNCLDASQVTTKSVSLYGGNGSYAENSLFGGLKGDYLYGGESANNNLLSGGGGDDYLYSGSIDLKSLGPKIGLDGGDGNDVLELSKNAANLLAARDIKSTQISVCGGNGRDTLKIFNAAEGQTIDLHQAVLAGKISGVERISFESLSTVNKTLIPPSKNTLTLQSSDISSLSQTIDFFGDKSGRITGPDAKLKQLVIDGDNKDVLSVTDTGWRLRETVTSQSTENKSFVVYSNSSNMVELYVNSNIKVNLEANKTASLIG